MLSEGACIVDVYTDFVMKPECWESIIQKSEEVAWSAAPSLLSSRSPVAAWALLLRLYYYLSSEFGWIFVKASFKRNLSLILLQDHMRFDR